MKIYKILSIVCIVVVSIFLCFYDNGENDEFRKSKDDMIYAIKNTKEYTDNKALLEEKTRTNETNEEKPKTNEETALGSDAPVYFEGQIAENETIVNYNIEDTENLDSDVLIELVGETNKKKYTFHLNEAGGYKDETACEKDVYNVECSVGGDESGSGYDIALEKKIDITDDNKRHTFNIGVKSKDSQVNEPSVEKIDTFKEVKDEFKKTWFTLLLFLALVIIYAVIKKKNTIGGEE